MNFNLLSYMWHHFLRLPFFFFLTPLSYLYLFTDSIQRKSIMDGDNVVYIFSMLSGKVYIYIISYYHHLCLVSR